MLKAIDNCSKTIAKWCARKLFRSGSGDIADFIQSLPQNRENPLYIQEGCDENSPQPDPCDIDNIF